jgi:hypothetical protein
MKKKLSERQKLQDLKSVIRSVIEFFGGDQNIIELFGGDQSIIEFLKQNGSDDTNVESITIITIDDNSYKVVIQLSPNSAKESSNPTKEYLLDW